MGEKTPTYSYDPKVPARIHRDFPGVKLVWIFRNPVDRTYSNYLHAICNGFDLLSFQDAVASEPERIRQNPFFGYVERSRYCVQVERFLRLFDRGAMHFMIFEHLMADTEGQLAALCQFLGVSALDRFRDRPRGQTVLPRWPRSLHWTRRIFGARSPALSVMKGISTVGRRPGYPGLTPEAREGLAERFRDDNRKLSELIGMPLEGWGLERFLLRPAPKARPRRRWPGTRNLAHPPIAGCRCLPESRASQKLQDLVSPAVPGALLGVLASRRS